MDVILDLCDQLLREITVQRVDSSSGGEVTGPVLWAAKLESGAGVNEMTIGEAPPGFCQEIALDGPLPHSEELVIIATKAQSELSIDVRLSELKNGEVQAGGEIVSREEFDSDRSAC